MNSRTSLSRMVHIHEFDSHAQDVFQAILTLVRRIILGIQIDIYGFDMGNKGLPNPKDYKDLPHIWKKGFYSMDEKKLKKKLFLTKLIIGDIKKNYF